MADTEKTKVALPKINVSMPAVETKAKDTEAAYAQRLTEGALHQDPLQVNVPQLNIPKVGEEPQNKADEAAEYAKRLTDGDLTDKTADGYKAGSFYTDFFNKNNPYQKRVEDAEEQLERMRRNKLFATIGSGFDAFHQAYANMRGVKPMESPKVADKYIAQYNALKKDRDANQLAYTNAYMQAMRNDAADKLNADMMKFREKQAEETKRHNDAMENIYADRITAGQQKADADRASREDIAEKNRASQEKRQAERNAATLNAAGISANSRKDVANIRYQNGGGRGTGGNVNKTETTTTSNRRGQTVKTVTKVTSSNKPTSSGGGTGGSGGSKGSGNYNKYKVNSNKGGNNYSQYKTK